MHALNLYFIETTSKRGSKFSAVFENNRNGHRGCICTMRRLMLLLLHDICVVVLICVLRDRIAQKCYAMFIFVRAALYFVCIYVCTRVCVCLFV